MYDIVIKNSEIYNFNNSFFGDIGIIGEKIAKIGCNLHPAKMYIDAENCLVLPGGIDSHCHIDQPTGDESTMADDFYSASRSALCGGTTTFIPFALQEKGVSLNNAVMNYHLKAKNKSFCDYGFHVIITDFCKGDILQEIKHLCENGYNSFKIYMTYENLKMSDYEILEILSALSVNNAVALIHAENDDCIRWLTNRLVKERKISAKYHVQSRPEIIENEAVYRVISYGELTNCRILVVHISSNVAFENINLDKLRGVKIFAETCPQYLFLTSDDLYCHGDEESGRYICSPPPRDKKNQKLIFKQIFNGNVDIFSSDHAPFNDDITGKRISESKLGFHKIPNGLPGLETRMALLLSKIIDHESMSINDFVKMTSYNQARLFGLWPQKGSISVGSDADIVIWKKGKYTIRNEFLHHAVDYTPYEGMEVLIWPNVVLLRGKVMVDRMKFVDTNPNGLFVPRFSSHFI